MPGPTYAKSPVKWEHHFKPVIPHYLIRSRYVYEQICKNVY